MNEHTNSVISPYLTAAEAAAYIRSTVQGIYSLVKRGRINPMPGSGKLLFTREALDKYLSGKYRR
jgi:excisionase family DNA binding protein